MNEDTREVERISRSPEETRDLGVFLGKRLFPGAVILLTGDLAAGKTVFVQGLALGAGVPADVPVASPSYTLVNEYPGHPPLVHADLYRLSGPEAIRMDLADIGLEELLEETETAVAIEWADRMDEEDFSGRLTVALKREGSTIRRIRIRAVGTAHEALLIGLARDLAADGGIHE
ncbi:MAG: tRNA (adenosine(37)-N6)-threonylcarbamoyltransferase complex ATPase subunit type 1 TsaE [Desulfobacterales bacterium]|nr:MAG: tRNA (adenosine(37)-N6)-threonylcarbamoyltransferase complex ATPase subunit type 1 TsaE [Desulfobacterales bacterium]